VNVLKVGKSVSLAFDDLKKINKKILEGESNNLSEFITKATKNELKR
jgi:hypothetical protein